MKTITVKEVLNIVPYSRGWLYVLIKAGKFPLPLQISKHIGNKRGGKLLWDIEDIHNWVNNKK